ncbi:MAG: Gfo/Idh/MocA family oxidoreductase [Ignavibacteriales bacterium]|nr:Gfo/Idh/MocA family oxidoreductase [Ignavibacteriales bacterium]
MDRFGPGRALDDNATVLVDFKGGARGVYWSSQIAAGHDNALRLRIYGTKGAVEWFQETPNTARVSFLDRPSGTVSRGRDPMSPRAQSLSRLPSGHPEGYFESFANIYATYLAALAKKLRGEPLAPADLDFPNVDDGVRGVRFIESCVESSATRLRLGRDGDMKKEESMARPVTLFTGQWADLPFEEVCQKAEAWGYDGLEIACWGDHMDVRRRRRRPGLRREPEAHPRASTASGAGRSAPTSPASASATACDPRLDGFAPAAVKGKPEAIAHVGRRGDEGRRAGRPRPWGATSSPASWARPSGRLLVLLPARRPRRWSRPASRRSCALWTPIFDEFDEQGVSFALEVHPTEIAFDLYTARRLLDAFDGRPDPRLQLRPEPPRLAGHRAAPLHPRLRRPHLPRPHEGRGA